MWLIQIAQVFKGGCLIIRLDELVIYIVKCKTFGIGFARQLTDTVRVHHLKRDSVLGGVGFSIPLSLPDSLIHGLFFSGGELYFSHRIFCFGQSVSPPFPDHAALPGTRRSCWFDRGGSSGG